MKHLFVPYELAVLLKEKGFDETVLDYYYDEELEGADSPERIPIEELTEAPLYHQVTDWLEQKGIYIEIHCSMYSGPVWWDWSIDVVIPQKRIQSGEGIYSGEDESYPDKYLCLNKAIEEALKLI